MASNPTSSSRKRASADDGMSQQSISTHTSRSKRQRTSREEPPTPQRRSNRPTPTKPCRPTPPTAPKAPLGPRQPTPTRSPSGPTKTPLPPTTPTPNTLTITEHTGDIFSAPPNSLLIHACNCQGSWSAGIAAAFKAHYPEAHAIYASHCRKWSADALFGTALLIKPTFSSSSSSSSTSSSRVDDARSTHFIACLFTSHHYGRRRDAPATILGATGPAMRDLLGQIEEWNGSVEVERRVGEVRMCRINSGLFRVKWEDTKAVVGEIEVEGSGVREVEVWEREGG